MRDREKGEIEIEYYCDDDSDDSISLVYYQK
jgi:hypothetical protein